MMQRKKKDAGWIPLNGLIAHFFPFFPEDMSPYNEDKLYAVADVYREAKECADKIWTSSRCPKSTYTRKDFVAHEAIKNEALRILTDSYTRGSNHDRAIIDRAFRSDIENYPEMLRIIESKKAQQVRTAEPSNPSACEPKGYSYE